MFSRFFIDRPIFSAVVSIIITLAGVLALIRLPVGQYPEISPPAVTISISYPGASAQVVADTVASPIEQQVNGVPGMLYINSNSGNDGSYTLTVTFEIGTNLNAALVMVQNRVQLALPQLPGEVQRQGITVRKRTPDILNIISFTSTDGRYDNIYLSNYATVNIRDELLRIEGVSDVTVFGQRDYSMRLWLDPQKLAARGITPLDVSAAIRDQNQEAAPGVVGKLPSGRNRSFQFSLDTQGRLSEPEQFGNIIVKAALPRAAVEGSASGSATMNALSAMPKASLDPLPLFTVPATGASDSGTGTTALSLPFTPAANTLAPGVSTTSSGAATSTGTTAGGTTGADNLGGGALDGGPNPASGIVRVRDIARIELGASSYDSGATFDGKPSVGLAVRLLPGANALEVADAVRQRMKDLAERFPEGVTYDIAYDTTPFIRESIEDVVLTLFEAVGLVAIVVLLFLQSWRATLIPMIAVPVAILGTFAIMLALGFTINNISLFGLVLAIGIVVDDAIVVVENVERWLDRGLSPKEAAYKAMEEVTGPIIAISLVLCAVFIPCAFVGGIPGQFYRQFAVTITASTVVSAINSLTLSPALAALLLKGRTQKENGKRGAAARAFAFILFPFALIGRGFNWLFELGTRVYAWIVGRLVRLSLVVLVGYGGLLFLTERTFSKAPIGFVPDQDQGRLIVSIQLPDSASLNRTQDVMAQVDAICLRMPGVAHTTSTAGTSIVAGGSGSNFGSLFLVLAPFKDRQKPELRGNAIMAKLRKEFTKIKDADVKVFGASPVPGLSAAGGFKLVVEDRGGIGLAGLQQQTDALVARMQKDPTMVGVLTQFRSRTPQLFLEVDRSKVEALGVNLNDVNQTMQIALGSSYVNSFNSLGRLWQVKLQSEGQFRNRIEDVNLLQVRNQKGEMVPLGTLLKLREINGPVSVNRYNLYTAAAISGNVPPDVSSGEAIAATNRITEEMLPRSMKAEWTELFFLQIRTGNTAIYVFLLAVVFVFLALAALYESWALPLAVILVVPLCLLCSVVGVRMDGKSVDIFVQIGLIVLVGLACKNAILIVEFAVVLRREGKSRHEAAVEASRMRIRPILMTSLAFILGVVPLMVASGAGAEMRRSLGIAVFSGMLGVTAFGIFLTPVFFDLIQRVVDSKIFASAWARYNTAFVMTGLIVNPSSYVLAKMEIISPYEAVIIRFVVSTVISLALVGELIWRWIRRNRVASPSLHQGKGAVHDGNNLNGSSEDTKAKGDGSSHPNPQPHEGGETENKP